MDVFRGSVLVAAGVVASLGSIGLAEEMPAPFGLTWGAPLAEVERDLNATVSPDLLWGRVHSVESSFAPILPPDTDMLSVAVDPEFGMGRVIWVSDNVTNDAVGSEGQEKYEELKAILTEKYGQPVNKNEVVGLDLWTEPDEFYQCLSYDGCGIWVSYWQAGSPSSSIALQLKGLDRGEGYLSMVYEGPNWQKIIDAVNAGEAQVKKDAF